jgi:DnaJ-class molecular chaperone
MTKGKANKDNDQHGNPNKAPNSKKYQCQTCRGTGSVGDKTCGTCNGTGEIG